MVTKDKGRDLGLRVRTTVEEDVLCVHDSSDTGELGLLGKPPLLSSEVWSDDHPRDGPRTTEEAATPGP